MVSSEQKVKNVLRGIVVSNKMDKTIVVEHERTYRNAKVQKVMRSVKKYKVHDENGQAQVGDTVEFYEGRPVSKTKYMYLARVVKMQA
ncbi:30S ribosomal protein S17 [Candidatus Dependentiae bacterium]|nr:30S ribosomal protein S17 [Candidatus Dependentiae bacterium]